MNIGFVGLGKLGLPCALATENAGHNVCGFDINPEVAKILERKILPYREDGAQVLLDKTNIELLSIEELIKVSDIIFLAVQTPHDPLFEGITRLPQHREDFNYNYLKSAIELVAQAAKKFSKKTNLVVISTVLPGTIDREIRPILNNYVKICYNPFFIAMGTTIRDFLHPEFVLFGVDDQDTATLAEVFYKSIHNRPFYKTTIKNAELIKVSYNTFISTKLAFVNTLLEVCQKTGCDVDAVTDALKLANERLISPKYMTAGMGDGGGCHPRDNIALSWLAQKLDLGYDFFQSIMLSREKQTDWFVKLIIEEIKLMPPQQATDVIILGTAFKANTNLTTGSPSLLLNSLLCEAGVRSTLVDPVVDTSIGELKFTSQALFFIGTKHDVFATVKFPRGSVVIDPHRYIADQDGVKVIRLGEGTK